MADPSAIARLLMGEPPPSNLPAYSWTPQPQGSLTNPYNDAMANMGAPVVSALAKLLAAPVNAARDFTHAHMAEYQPGMSVNDMPQTMNALPAAAMSAVGFPGGVGGLGSGARLPMYRAGEGRGRGGVTYYSEQPAGAAPYGAPKEYQVTAPDSTFDAAGKHWKIYQQFLDETGHPAGRGKNGLPFWTAGDDLKAWLDSKGMKHDAIRLDENTGIPSLAIYGQP